MEVDIDLAQVFRLREHLSFFFFYTNIKLLLFHFSFIQTILKKKKTTFVIFIQTFQSHYNKIINDY